MLLVIILIKFLFLKTNILWEFYLFKKMERFKLCTSCDVDYIIEHEYPSDYEYNSEIDDDNNDINDWKFECKICIIFNNMVLIELNIYCKTIKNLYLEILNSNILNNNCNSVIINYLFDSL